MTEELEGEEPEEELANVFSEPSINGGQPIGLLLSLTYAYSGEEEPVAPPIVEIRYWPTMALKKLQVLLTQYLTTDVLESDESRAAMVKIGTLQADPIRLKVAVEIHENDPHGDIRWFHSRENLAANPLNPRRIRGPAIGNPGRSRWLRRFALFIHIFPSPAPDDTEPMDRERASRIKGTVVSRIEQCLLDYPTLDGIMDDAGEHMDALPGFIMHENVVLSGDDRQPIYRVKLWLQFPTLRRNL